MTRPPTEIPTTKPARIKRGDGVKTIHKTDAPAPKRAQAHSLWRCALSQKCVELLVGEWINANEFMGEDTLERKLISTKMYKVNKYFRDQGYNRKVAVYESKGDPATGINDGDIIIACEKTVRKYKKRGESGDGAE